MCIYYKRTLERKDERDRDQIVTHKGGDLSQVRQNVFGLYKSVCLCFLLDLNNDIKKER